jgi:hypothetical protein
MEQVAVRSASFASNQESLHSVHVRLPHPKQLRQEELAEDILDLATKAAGFFTSSNPWNHLWRVTVIRNIHTTDAFWIVKDSTRELFSESLEKMHANGKMVLYPRPVVTLFRIFSLAGACALWFDGS